MTFKISQFVHKFVPARGQPNGSLVILVHGRTGNVKIMEWYSKRFDLPGTSYLMIEAPYPDTRPDQVEPGYAWYLFPGFHGLAESRVLLSDMMDEINAQGFEYKKIFWLGFSQGAIMGLDMALRSRQRFGGFICISGLCTAVDDYPQAFGPLAREQNILITHGTRDEIITLDLAMQTYEVLKTHAIPFEFREFDKPHSVHLKLEIPYLEATLKRWIEQS